MRVLLLGGLAWTVTWVIWFAPTACEWWRDYHDIIVWRETGGPPYPRRGEHFISDLPYKVAFALVIPVLGYAPILAMAWIAFVAQSCDEASKRRRHGRLLAN